VTPASWYRGDCHVHTERSHGAELTPARVVAAARNAGLDFIAITEHNAAHSDDGWGSDLLVIPGQAGLRAGHSWIAESASVELSFTAGAGDRTAGIGERLGAEAVVARVDVSGVPDGVVGVPHRAGTSAPRAAAERRHGHGRVVHHRSGRRIDSGRGTSPGRRHGRPHQPDHSDLRLITPGPRCAHCSVREIATSLVMVLNELLIR
jgi:hypothetical protein